MRTIELLKVGLIENKVVNEVLDDQRWGFLLGPKFEKKGVELNIIFDLLLPINKFQHLYAKSGSTFYLYDSDKTKFKTEIETLAGLVQTAMAHTRLFIMLHNPQLGHLPMKYFDNNYFIEEIKTQLGEL